MPRYDEAEARAAVEASRSYSEVLRRLGMRPAGGNHRLVRKYVDEVGRIPTDHFDAGGSTIRNLQRTPIPLAEILVEGSTYSRCRLKERLFNEGLKERRCEQCGQGELWRGRSMSLIASKISKSFVPTVRRRLIPIAGVKIGARLSCARVNDATSGSWSNIGPTRTALAIAG